MFECDCYGAFAVEGDLTRHHLVKKHADGVDIGKYTYLPANSLFGRQVVHGADDRSGLRQRGRAGSPAMPKSVTFTCPSRVTRMLWGLMSR